MHDVFYATETPPIPVSRAQSIFAPQSLEKFDRATRRQGRPDPQAPWRRFIVFGGALGITAYLVRELYLVLSVGSIAGLEVALLLLFTINIFWLALSFMTALSGFVVIALRMRRSLVRVKDYDLSAPLSGKTAVIICTYNEAPARIFGLAVATMRSLAKLGKVENFDLFILSDTTDPDTWVHEEAAFQSVREREDMGSRIFYRRRSANTGKKAGNVADWCRRWGANYEYMLVLDADSLMTGESLVRLAAIIENNPDFGLVQTVPISIGRNTLFARLQQFAGRLYGPMLATGLSFWHRGNSNFWGHNAIIRTRAFIESAGLPVLPGKPPFGGQILSHDFVEAALLNRAGWRVCMVPDLVGSYEEIPPSLIDFAMRDRRWAQGNLQHSRVLFASGLHWVSRVHMAMGIMAYVSALFWLLFLVFALALTFQSIYTVPNYFSDSFPLFPVWPMQDSERSLKLLLLTLGILLLPKLFAYLLAVMNAKQRRGFGGAVHIAGRRLDRDGSLVALRPHHDAAAIDRGGRCIPRPGQRMEAAAPRRRVLAHRRDHALSLEAHGDRRLPRRAHVPGLVHSLPLDAASLVGPGFLRAAFGLVGQEIGGRSLPATRAPSDTGGEIATLDRREVAEVQKGLEETVLEREAITQLAASSKLRRLHRQLIQMQPVSLESRISPNLAIGRAKLEVSSSLSELLNLLKPGEKAALLSDPESLVRLEALIPAEIPPETAHHSSLQTLEETP